MPGVLIGRGRKPVPECDGSCRQPAEKRTATEKAQTFLAWTGVIVLAASMNVILRAVAVAAISVVVLAMAGAGVLAVRWRRRRSRWAELVPAPVPEVAARTRTTVTGVQVRAVGPARTPAGLPARRVRSL